MTSSSPSPRGAFERRFAALMAEAQAGGPDAAQAARRAAAMALARDPRRAEEALAHASALDPLDAVSTLALAQLRADRGDLDAARVGAAQAFSDAIDESARALAAFALGEIALARGDAAQARDAFQAAKSLQADILRHEPGDYEALRHYARACQRLADFTASDDGAAAARIAHGEALTLLETLAQRDDALVDLAEDLAFGCARLAHLCLELGDHDGARACAEARVGWLMRLADDEPDNEAWRVDLADAWELCARLALEAHDIHPAQEASSQALHLRVALAAAAPGDAKRRRAQAKRWARHAEILAQSGDLHGARSAAAHARGLREADTDSLGAQALHDALILEGDLALKARDYEGARILFSRACEHAQPRAYDDNAWRTALSQVWGRLGETALQAHHFAQARDSFARMRALSDASNPRLAARLLLKEGEAALGAGDKIAARALFQQSCAIRLDLVDAAPQDMALARELAVALERLGVLAHEAGDIAAAHAAWEDEARIAEIMLDAIGDSAAMRFAAIVHGLLAGLASPDATAHRKRGLALLDDLARQGALTEQDIALRTRLWGG
ncbi:MAG: hypothetical protein GC206_12035 [Alphaproteobacteria bacterium]|nr:hypothetical protein [Alphaproteobacteria bacterium]